MPSTPLAKARFLAIDLEMTGLDPDFDEIIELAAIPMIGIEIGDGEAFYAEIRPERNIPAETKAVHGLHGRELSNAPVLTDVLPQLAKMMHGRIVVAHNVAVDFDFIRTKARIAGFAPPERPLLDTAEIARVLFPERNRLGLDELLSEFDLKRPGSNHNALSDAILTAGVFAKMLLELKKTGRARNVKDLMRIGGVR
ncbi:hypothetical protein DRQ36_10560 [bacterium]|nr:MAG: hypothetical protein DRQ36_10560 [bacterium]